MFEKFNQIINELCAYEDEREWFEFKENKFDLNDIGEYISALSNSAAIIGKPYAYLVWGINNITHEITGTIVNYQKEINNEPLQHYLARSLNPSISFSFDENIINGKRVVLLSIPAAKIIPTDFKGNRYIRIGSSKENLKKYPERESSLFLVLSHGMPSIVNTASEYQNLEFGQLLSYYGAKNIRVNKKSFVNNLSLKTESGKYNILAQLLSDNSHIPIRVAIFAGKDKTSKLYSIKEFGYKCLIYSLQDVLNYGYVLNIIQVDETNRVMERKDVPLFDIDAYREAVVNAFLHNKWVDINEPMITVYENRIEIMSRGTLPPLQTIEGFFEGNSIPVNQKLSEIFLQLHISEKTGRGIPTIAGIYGQSIFNFKKNRIIVTIPFNRINSLGNDMGNKVGIKMGNKTSLNGSQYNVLSEIRNNPNISKKQLQLKCGLSKTTIDNCINVLKKKEIIERIGSRKSGYWKVIDNQRFNKTINMGNKVGIKMGNKTSLNGSQYNVLSEIRNNPNISKKQLQLKCGLSKTTIDNCINVLKKKEIIERIGSRKSGYWKVIEE